MSNLLKLREDAQKIIWVIQHDPSKTQAVNVKQYLTSLNPDILALFTAQCLVIVNEVAKLTDTECGHG